MKEKKSDIIIYSDGSCLGNPGPGGYAALIVANQKVLEIAGYALQTTNNQMELKAIIHALNFVYFLDQEIICYTDSMYIILGITQWITEWKKKNWKNNTVKNKDLWERLDVSASAKKISWRHVSAHKGIVGNERVNSLAQSYAQHNFVKLYRGELKDYLFSWEQLFLI